jgi:hypothetical protein
VPTPLTESDLARLLPGDWNVAATNLGYWLSGKRSKPTLSYELLSSNPVTFTDVVSFATAAGESKSIVGVDRFAGRGFVWRGKGLLRVVTSRWAVSGANDEGSVLVIKYDKTVLTSSGIDVIVRSGVVVPEVRSIVATGADGFGLSLEEFASLTWIETGAEHGAAS